MTNLLTLLNVITAATVTTNSSNLSQCLAAAGVNVTANLIERTFENYLQYVDINFQWQERGEHRLPMAYLKVYSAADVQSAVRCGRGLGLAVVARGGGHGYLKYAYGQNDDITLVLDLQTLNSISVNREAKIASIDAGARLGHVAYQLYANGNFMIPYGTCVSVGISGYTLGGGHSLFSYLYGLGSDNVIEMEMVDANGELLTINNRTNEDLFWALRGAGISASFGIVTKFVYQLHEAPHHIVLGFVEYRVERFHEFFPVYQELFTQTRDKPIFHAFLVNETHVTGMFADVQSVTEAETVGANLVEEALDAFVSPDNRLDVETITFPGYLTNFARIVRLYGYIQPDFILTEPSDLMKVSRYGIGSEWFKSKSFFVKKLLNENEILALQQLIRDANLPDIHINAESFSGKIHEFDAQTDSSFFHRDAYYYVYMYMIREKDDDPAVSAKFNEFFEKTKDIFNHTESYQNYPDDEIPDFLERYYGANLPRLIDIKTNVDPDDFFNTNPQSIPVRRMAGGSGATSNQTERKIILISLCLLIIVNIVARLHK